MKKIFEFNWPEDREEYELHDKGPEAIWLLQELTSKLRHELKHGFIEEKYGEGGDEFAEKLLEEIWQEIEARGLSEVV